MNSCVCLSVCLSVSLSAHRSVSTLKPLSRGNFFISKVKQNFVKHDFVKISIPFHLCLAQYATHLHRPDELRRAV